MLPNGLRRFLALFVGLIVIGPWLLGGCTDDDGDETSGTPVVVDSDGAFDDLKAILFLLEQDDVDVRALTMSGTGVAHCPVAAENMAAVLERIDGPEIPVACGRTTPLRGDNEAPAIWRAAADGLGGVDLPEPRSLSEQAAPDLLAETISSSDEKVVLVALGPLTNIAEAIEADPGFLDNVEMVYLMGGAVDVGGNVMYANPAAEFNIWADPYAAAVLFDTEVPITLVPLDATNAVPVTPYLYETMDAHRDASEVSRFLADVLDGAPLFGGLYHWDELAAVVSVDETVATFETRTLDIVEDGGPGGGITIESPEGREVRVAVDADAKAFEDHFYRAMIGTSETGVEPWEPDAVVSWDGTSCTFEGPDALPDRAMVRVDNSSSEVVALITGRFAPGTTSDDWNAYLASGVEAPPPWWSEQDMIPVPPGARDVWAIAGGSDLTAMCFVDADRVFELAGPTLAEIEAAGSDGETALPAETFDAAVSFVGEACVYDGPVDLPDRAEVTFDFTTDSDQVSLIVVAVHEGTTWEEIAEFVVDNRASVVPPFVNYTRIGVQSGAGTLVMGMQAGDYLVTCNTSADSTDTAHPASLIEVGG